MKSETRNNPKPETSTKYETAKQRRYDLENRALIFARDVRQFVPHLPKTTAHLEDGKQLVRSSGSIGASYLEAHKSLSKKDFVMRVKTAKKEAREAIWWLEVMVVEPALLTEQQRLLKESTELMNILGAIARSAT